MPNAYENLPVLVTGGAGFIGSSLVRGLLAAGAQVRVLDNLSHGSPKNLADIVDQIELQLGDITNPRDCQTAVDGIHAIFHLAALGSVPRSVEEPLLYNRVNVEGTLNLLEAARHAGAKRFVYSASSSAYGDAPTSPKTESMTPLPKSPYAVSKLAGEYYARVYAELHSLQSVSLRYFNVFGPRQNPKSQYAAVIPAFIDALLAQRPPTIFGDGHQTRDFCFVDNVVQANMLAGSVALGHYGQTFNVGCGQSISLNDVLASIQQILSTQITPTYAPARPGDVRDSLADIAAIRHHLGYTPKTLFAEGIKIAVNWYTQHRPTP